MKIRIIAPVERFNLENNYEGVDLSGIELLRGQDFLDNESDTKFARVLGEINMRIIKRSYVLSYTGESLLDESKIISLHAMANLHLDQFHAFFNNLWFIKDNSSALTSCYVQDLDSRDIGYSQKPLIISDSQEGYESAEYSLSDLQSLVNLYDRTVEYTKVDNSFTDSVKSGNKFITGSLLNHIIGIENRIGRALILIDSVRTYPYLPQKIASYIAVFECLFTTFNGELTHQVSERVALFVGSDLNDKMDIYNLVKKCYGIRSTFVHGDQIKLKRDQLLLYSKNIDALARRVMLKVIRNPDIFLKKQSDAKYPIDDYFKELLFK